jgi:hypothetical protein
LSVTGQPLLADSRAAFDNPLCLIAIVEIGADGGVMHDGIYELPWSERGTWGKILDIDFDLSGDVCLIV